MIGSACRAGGDRVPRLVNLLAILLAAVAPTVSLGIYAGLPVLYFLSITILRLGRKRNIEYAEFI
jgi:hypothetical protein